MKTYPSATEAKRRPPEQMLWRAVVARTVKDAMGGCTISECAAARTWLQREDNPFRDTVCDLAGLDPERLRSWACSSLQPLSTLFRLTGG